MVILNHESARDRGARADYGIYIAKPVYPCVRARRAKSERMHSLFVPSGRGSADHIHNF
jgi:hypothetical protein